MGYEVIVQKGDVPNAGKPIERRYTNIYYFEEGRWRLVARQTTYLRAIAKLLNQLRCRKKRR
jgi:hypothetical protein